jgi:hypothetical protein
MQAAEQRNPSPARGELTRRLDLYPAQYLSRLLQPRSIVSQSGGLGFAIGQCASRGAELSHVLASGKASAVDMAELVAYLPHLPGVDSRIH